MIKDNRAVLLAGLSFLALAAPAQAQQNERAVQNAGTQATDNSVIDVLLVIDTAIATGGDRRLIVSNNAGIGAWVYWNTTQAVVLPAGAPLEFSPPAATGSPRFRANRSPYREAFAFLGNGGVTALAVTLTASPAAHASPDRAPVPPPVPATGCACHAIGIDRGTAGWYTPPLLRPTLS